MRRVIAAINMTLDGFCDHTAIIADEELHQHYSDLLIQADTILYGRITYQLMQFWQTVVKNPTGNKGIDEFAVIMDKVPKIVFSHTLKDVEWESARLAGRGLKEEVLEIRQKEGGDIFVGSRSLIISLLKLNLIDELQLCVHPTILGNGLTPLLVNISDSIDLKLVKTKTLHSGAVILYYEITKK
jgi:dihydrofolate reductase